MSIRQEMKWLLNLTLLLFCVVGVAQAKTKQTQGYPPMAVTKAKGKLLKHFDRNQDGYIDYFEASILRSYRQFHYPLAKKKKHLPYDFNNDGMLAPHEVREFKKDEARGTLRQFVKNQKDSENKVMLTPQDSLRFYKKAAKR